MSDDKSEKIAAQREEITGVDSNSKQKPSIAFEEISEGANEVLILYKDQVYRLRETKNGKLILNK